MVEASTTIATPTSPSKRIRPGWRFRDLRLVPAIDTDPGIVAFAQSLAGRLTLFLTMAALTGGHPERLAVVCLAALVAYLPAWRAVLMPLSTALVIIAMPMLAERTWPSLAHVGTTFGIFAIAAGLLVIARQIGRRGPFAWPVTSLFVAVTAAAGLGCLPVFSASLQATFWLAATTLAAFMWFLAYALVNATGRQPRAIPNHLAMLHPFWGSTSTPFGKGAAFLAKFEARTPEDLALTQLKAVKLLVWANVLQFVLTTFDYAVSSKVGVPPLVTAITAHAAGHSFGRAASTASIVTNFVDNMLSLTIMGHMFVSACRYAGFRIPRNTYRPLTACSISEFWNRYYFYFKELLVDFFFMPAFTRLRGWPTRARILAATFCAAGLGNYLFHFYRDIALVREIGLARSLEGSLTYAFYCLVLSIGIGCSQMVKQSAAPARARDGFSIMSCISVVGFYCLISVFSYDGRTLTLGDHIRFLLYIFGMNT